MHISLYADGASRGNPGEASCGAIAYTGSDVLFEVSEIIGVATNNVAEYRAVIFAVKRFADFDITSADIYLDSKLVVEQMSGRWKVKQDHLRILHAELTSLILESGVSCVFSHVRREKNTEADALANAALDSLN